MNNRIRNKARVLKFLLFLFISGRTFAQIPVGEDSTPIYDAVYFDSLAGFSHDEVQVRKVNDSTIQKLKKDDAFWYADAAPEKNREERNNGPVEVPVWLKNLVWIVIVISMLAVVLWFLASSNIQLFRRPSAVVAPEQEDFISDDIFGIDFEKEISRARTQQNYRLAIRLFYLRTLKELSELSLIDYKHERTNSEYLSQLADTIHYNDFFRLTRDFEYVWYGKFELSKDAFQQVENDFVTFREGLVR